MTIQDIIQIEADRENKLNVVHLIKEGKFYHANDWSAWLMTQYPIGEAKKKPMQVTARKLKGDYIHAFVGFPESSIGKYLPDDEVVLFNPVNDTQIDVTLKIDFGDEAVEQIRKKVEDWKNSLPIVESKKQRGEDRWFASEAVHITKITDIISRMVSLRMEDMSPRQAYDFLRDMQHQIADIF